MVELAESASRWEPHSSSRGRAIPHIITVLELLIASEAQRSELSSERFVRTNKYKFLAQIQLESTKRNVAAHSLQLKICKNLDNS